MPKKDLSEIMGICDQRRYIRLKKNFQVTLHKRVPVNLDLLLKGNTLDLSRGGSIIKTGGWHLFEPNEITELTFFSQQDLAARILLLVYRDRLLSEESIN